MAVNRENKDLAALKIDMKRHLRVAAGTVLTLATVIIGPLLLARGSALGDPPSKKADEVRTVMLPPPSPPPVRPEERAIAPEVRAPKPEQKLTFNGLDGGPGASPEPPKVVQATVSPKTVRTEVEKSVPVERLALEVKQVPSAREPEAPASESNETRQVGAGHVGSGPKPGGTTGQKRDGGISLPAIEVEGLDEQAVRRLVEAKVALLIGMVDGRCFCWDGGGWKLATRESLPFVVTELGPTLRPEAVQGIVRGLREVSSGVPRIELRLAPRAASALTTAVMLHMDRLGLGGEAWRDVPGLVVTAQSLPSGEFKVLGHRGYEAPGGVP